MVRSSNFAEEIKVIALQVSEHHLIFNGEARPCGLIGYVTAGTHKVLWFDQMIQSAELESPIRFIN